MVLQTNTGIHLAINLSSLAKEKPDYYSQAFFVSIRLLWCTIEIVSRETT